jgi:hypothetical protein
MSGTDWFGLENWAFISEDSCDAANRRTMQACIFGFVDDAHTAAERLNNTVMGDGLGDE